MKNILFKLPIELHTKLKVKAATENKSITILILSALEEYLSK